MRRKTVAALVAAASLAGSLAATRAGAVGVQPARVLDTRTGVGAAARLVSPGDTVVLPVAPAVAAGAGAVSLNLTATDAASAGFVTAWPCGQARPATSVLNTVPGRVVANHVIVGVGTGGVCLAASQPVHLVADLMGWFTDPADYRGAAPTRLVDTRATGQPLAAGVERVLPVTGGAGYAAGAAAVALNVTVVSPGADGYLVVYPCGPRPLASTVNFKAGEIVPNFTLVSSTGGSVCLYSNVATHVVVDTFGWSTSAATLRLGTPARVLDTRSRVGWSTAARPATTVELRVAGRGNVPNDAAAALLTLTATGGTADGYVTAWPCDQPRPLASVLNLRPGYLGSNLVYVPLSAADGEVCLYAATSDGSSVHLVADAVGWETGGPSRSAPPAEPPPGTGRFETLPVGAALPSDEACAAAVRDAPEVRAVNAPYNATRGSGPNPTYPRVTGNFTGTTDEILQWAACKWGIDEDVVRAQIVKESWWRMTTVGDNGESRGLGQVRQPYHPLAFPDAASSTAFNVDYTYAVWRSCFEGELTWLNTVERRGTYGPGDMWGCAGVWFAGRWHTQPADTYIAEVQAILAERTWETANFLNG